MTSAGSPERGEASGVPHADNAGRTETTARARPRGRVSGRQRAAGIYGAILTAAILASAGGKVSTGFLTVDVLVSLFVYWTVEVYAELLGVRVDEGTPPGHREIRDELTQTWPLVGSSFGPLAIVVIARLAGASDSLAASFGLGGAALLLVSHTWAAGRAARLRGVPLFLMTVLATALGAVMILLKNLVLVHLH